MRLLSTNHPTGLQDERLSTMEQLKYKHDRELDATPLSEFIRMSSGEKIPTEIKRPGRSARDRVSYSADENLYLRSARADGVTYREIGEVLGRTKEAVQHQAALLGLTRPGG